MSELKFEVGKKYKHVRIETMPNHISMIRDSGVFECHRADNHGNCWSMDCEYNGRRLHDGEGWSAAVIMQLKTGEVIEVTE